MVSEIAVWWHKDLGGARSLAAGKGVQGSCLAVVCLTKEVNYITFDETKRGDWVCWGLPPSHLLNLSITIGCTIISCQKLIHNYHAVFLGQKVAS